MRIACLQLGQASCQLQYAQFLVGIILGRIVEERTDLLGKAVPVPAVEPLAERHVVIFEKNLLPFLGKRHLAAVVVDLNQRCADQRARPVQKLAALRETGTERLIHIIESGVDIGIVSVVEVIAHFVEKHPVRHLRQFLFGPADESHVSIGGLQVGGQLHKTEK